MWNTCFSLQLSDVVLSFALKSCRQMQQLMGSETGDLKIRENESVRNFLAISCAISLADLFCYSVMLSNRDRFEKRRYKAN